MLLLAAGKQILRRSYVPHPQHLSVYVRAHVTAQRQHHVTQPMPKTPKWKTMFRKPAGVYHSVQDDQHVHRYCQSPFFTAVAHQNTKTQHTGLPTPFLGTPVNSVQKVSVGTPAGGKLHYIHQGFLPMFPPRTTMLWAGQCRSSELAMPRISTLAYGNLGSNGHQTKARKREWYCDNLRTGYQSARDTRKA